MAVPLFPDLSKYEKTPMTTNKWWLYWILLINNFWLRALVVAYGWNHFAVEAGASAISNAEAFGLAILTSYLTKSIDYRKTPLDDLDKFNALDKMILSVLISLLSWLAMFITWNVFV